MRLLALVPSIYDKNPSQRYRIEQWEPHLRTLGVEITYRPFDDEALNAVIYQPGQTAKKVDLILRALARRARGMREVRGF
ncbi:MAG: hypothetical protein LC754_09205, partial [Acidobacteria bacterium]|nr:hypothetical protein [Acidobacteriota bacterium]